MKQGSGRRYPILNTHNALVEGFGANQKEGQYELRGFAPTCREPPGRAIGMLEYWNDGILGLKQHSAKGRGQRVKNFYTMRYARCLFSFHVRGKTSGLEKLTNFLAFAGYKCRDVQLEALSTKCERSSGVKSSLENIFFSSS